MSELPDYSRIGAHYERYPFSNVAIVNVTYWGVCVVIIWLIIFSWSFVVEVSTLSPGIIRPCAETSDVRSAFNGRIRRSFVRENQLVQAGDTLCTLETEALIIRQKYLSDRLSETRQLIADLKILTRPGEKKLLRSSHFQQVWATFLQKMSESGLRLKKAQADYRRNLKLHGQMVIADTEMEGYKYELERAKNEVALTKKMHENQWQSELLTYEREMTNLESELEEVNREIKSMVIVSPITGTLQRFAGIYPGTVVHSNQDLAQISPEAELIVEAFVSPANIGLLHIGMNVRFLIDAFNYNQWGFAEGTIMDISKDVHLVNNAPVFKIRCSLNRNYLELKNGYKGVLKKGMSLKARFIVTERTLWQLLYDNTNDWLNPIR